MSLFDRFPPPKARQTMTRFEMLRRSGRKFDVSHSLAAGAMVVLAHSDDNSPLPFGLEVQGDKVEGAGTIFYQFVLPMDRSKINQEAIPTTEPSTEPEKSKPEPEKTAALMGN
jgi:hypothetical protein